MIFVIYDNPALEYLADIATDFNAMSERDFLISMGKRIKDARVNKNLKQAELAEICKIEKASLSRLESGQSNPTISTLLKVSKALEVPVQYFFFDRGRP